MFSLPYDFANVGNMVAPKFDDDVKLGGFDHNHTYLLAIYWVKNNLFILLLTFVITTI
jgi:hypothetical protein